MAKLSLYEVNQAQLEQIPKIDGQLIVISDTGSIYRDIVVNGVVNRILIGNDIIAVDELPLAPISNKIYYLKPNKLYTYNSGWVDLTSGSDVVQIQSDYFQNDPAEPNHIKNRPFYDTRKFEDIIWDGNTEGLEVVTKASIPAFSSAAMLYVYKISDTCLTTDMLTGSVLDYFDTENKTEILNSSNLVTMDSGSSHYGYHLFCVNKMNETFDLSQSIGVTLTITSVGVWFTQVLERKNEVVKVNSLRSDGIIKQIEEKFIPDTIQGVANLTTIIDENSTDTQYPSAKAVYDLIGDCDTVINSINTLVGGEDT